MRPVARSWRPASPRPTSSGWVGADPEARRRGGCPCSRLRSRSSRSLAPLTQRWAAGIALLVVAALGLATAFAAVGVSVAFAQSLAVPIWPGAGLSLAWLGALGGALVALDIGSGAAPGRPCAPWRR